MYHPGWIIILIAGIGLAVLGIVSMAGSPLMGWMMIVFALGFFVMSYKTYQMNNK